MVATYIFAGLRREELLWLTHEDIDWTAKPYGIIRIRGKAAEGASWQPKTKKNRAIPVGSRLRPYLDKQRVRAAKTRGCSPRQTASNTTPIISRATCATPMRPGSSTGLTSTTVTRSGASWR
jgi:hypothetical protein